MTYIEKLKEQHPKWGNKNVEFVVRSRCPMNVFKENNCAPYCEKDPLLTCDKCWQQEYKE